MSSPQVNWTLPDGSIRQLYADRAASARIGVWTFFNVTEFEQAGETAPLVPSSSNQSCWPCRNSTKRPAEIESEIKISSTRASQLAQTEHSALGPLGLSAAASEFAARRGGQWLFTKFYGRLAAPWTCLVVVLIAIPFGAASGRRNLFVGVAGSIFICFAYFVIQQVSLALGTGGYLPAWLAAWLPNMIFGAIGLCADGARAMNLILKTVNDELARLMSRHERLQLALSGEQRHPLHAGFAGGAAIDRERGRAADARQSPARWF